MAMAAVSPGVDLISDLPDDLLLRILFFLPAASEVARTSALSRRWRHLWPNAVALRFTVGRYPKTRRYSAQADRDEAVKLIVAASAALARRAGGGGPDVEDLDLSFVYGSGAEIGRVVDNRSVVHSYEPLHAADITPPHVAAWLGFAARRVTGRLTLAVPRVPEKKTAAAEEDEEDEYYGYGAADEVKKGLSAAELPCSARAREMILILGGATVTVPAAIAAGAFGALADVLLSHASMDAGGGDGARLGRLLSSSCSPRLRRLQLGFVKGIGELRLDAAGTLEEIQLLHLDGLRVLDVDAPGLHVLGIDECYDILSAAMSAPRLRMLSCRGHMCLAGRLRFDGAASIRRIEQLQLEPLRRRRIGGDGEEEEGNDESAAVWFLRNSTAVDWLVVHMSWPLSFVLKNVDGVEFEYEDNITKHIPHLPSIRNLKIGARAFPSEHTIAATVAKLIAKCTEIEDLTIELWSKADEEECSDSNCICNHPKGWESQKISLEHLRNVMIYSFLAFDSQINLVRLLLTSTTALEKMTILLQMPCSKSRKVVAFHIPCYGGCWVGYDWMRNHRLGVTWARKYEWTRVGKGQEGERIHLDGMCIF